MTEASRAAQFVPRPPACGVVHAWLDSPDIYDLQIAADARQMHVDTLVADLVSAIIRNKLRDRIIDNLLGL